MGAINFSLDARLVGALQAFLPLHVLVETGTFHGNTVAEFESCFNKVISIELSETLWANAVKRFESNIHVQILKGDSAVRLHELSAELDNTSVLFWLDAHWCAADNTAGEFSQCPLLEELQAICKLNAESVILIDDARFFLAPPLAPQEISQWPSFHHIVSQLLKMSSEHELMVENDVIAFFPIKVKPAMELYAQKNGTDWLQAASCLKESVTYMQQLVEKEAVVQWHIVNSSRLKVSFEKSQAELAELKVALIDKESLILSLSKVITAYRVAHFFNIARLSQAMTARARRILAPRLGNLNQHTPVPLRDFPTKIKTTLLGNYPTISIVTPSFSQGHFIERTLLSVLSQEYPKLEYFVQDGGSKDNTTDILKCYEDKLFGWKSEKDNGQSQAINLGFANTKGEIMAWLNSDDLLLPNALAIVADYFNKHPEVDVVYGNRLLVDENDMEIGRWILPGHDGKVLTWVDYIPQETLFWRRTLWDKAGGNIDESFRFAMDWDLLVRFREVGAKFAHIPHFLGAFRIHEQQKTSAAINKIGHQEMDRIRERLLGSIPSRKEIRRHVTPFMLRHIAVDMLYRVKVRLGVK